MRLLALTEGPNHVCYRYRIQAFGPALAAAGWRLESLPLDPHTFARSPQLREAASADVVVLQRKLLPLWQLRLLRKRARVLVYDFDDALFHRDSYSPKGPSSLARLAHFWATIYAADVVLAGNRYLAEQAASYIEPARVHLVPTCVSPARYSLAAHHRHGSQVKLVWIGQHSTLPCLDRAQPLLAAAALRLPGLSLRVISNKFPDLASVAVEPRQWSMLNETQELADADVGLSWLPDDPWSQGKCGLKVLQYMAAGLPVVANPVGLNREMIQHGRNGFLATTAAQWADAIERLAHDPALRRAMGRAGRELVERNYSVERWAPKFVSLIEPSAADLAPQVGTRLVEHAT